MEQTPKIIEEQKKNYDEFLKIIKDNEDVFSIMRLDAMYYRLG